MKFPAAFFAVIFLITFTGCTDDPAGPVYNSAYFPLKTGNIWEYNGSVEMIVEVKKAVVLDNKGYYMIERSFPQAKDTFYLRYESDDRLMIYFEGEEYLYIDFTSAQGTTWNTYYNFYGEIRQKGITDTVTAGIFHNVTEVLFENTVISDVYEFNRYAPGVGMIFSMGFRRFFELRSAVVDGRRYP